MSDVEFARERFLDGADPDEHVRRIGEMTAIDGATVVCLQGIGDHDPLTSIRRYGEEVLPRLRREREGRFERKGAQTTS